MSTMSGFKGWVRGVLAGLDTWEKKLGSASEPIDHDLASLRSTLTALLDAKAESVSLATLRALGAKSRFLAESAAPVLAEEDMAAIGDLALGVSFPELAVLGMLAAKGDAGVDEELFTARDQKLVKALASKRLVTFGDQGMVYIAPKGLKLYKNFAKAILREELNDFHAAILAEDTAEDGTATYVLAIPVECADEDAKALADDFAASLKEHLEELGLASLSVGAAVDGDVMRASINVPATADFDELLATMDGATVAFIEENGECFAADAIDHATVEER